MKFRPDPAFWRVAGLAASLAAAACGGDSKPSSVPIAPAPVPAPTPDPAPAPGLLLPDDLSAVLLEVWVHGGFLPPAYSLALPPIYWLTVGGTLYAEAPTPSPRKRVPRCSVPVRLGAAARARAPGSRQAIPLI